MTKLVVSEILRWMKRVPFLRGNDDGRARAKAPIQEFSFGFATSLRPTVFEECAHKRAPFESRLLLGDEESANSEHTCRGWAGRGEGKRSQIRLKVCRKMKNENIPWLGNFCLGGDSRSNSSRHGEINLKTTRRGVGERSQTKSIRLHARVMGFASILPTACSYCSTQGATKLRRCM